MQELISKKYIFVDKTYKDQDALFEELGQMLIDDGFAKPNYIDALRQREEKFPTGLQTSRLKIAIPHTEPQYVNKPCIVVTKLAEPVVFNEMGKNDSPISVDMVVMMAINDGKRHLSTLQKIVSIMGDDALLDQLNSANTCNEIYEVFDYVINN
ncbi:PTS sugar transporter subunit IIA [Enterococcus hulanensis]|uniref:PTS sugar transporter subunit IIA n=1 Tax=Enterococcus TaxID=1350 RepID=UPI000B5A59BD|nr:MULTISPECIES: PTS sugar transporter subunit IIA [Enterococcus]MBO0409636.1 PTS sugar transporter subunit IIA [Enterococcus hulanensis]OTO20998.1 hypothetical protein A5875_002370 [Enterococcus sp. 3H8_DIV0648]